MTQLVRLSARLYNTPLLVRPDVAEALAAALGERLAGARPQGKPRAYADYGEGGADYGEGGEDVPQEPYAVADGIATIQVRGELVNRGSWLSSVSGMTSYDGLRAAMRQAAADPRVARVVLDIDSPGGEASGAMETADEVRALTSIKPVTAFVNSMAASAAYAIAAGASEIVVTPSASVGSIGVVWLHLDRSKALAEDGIRPTLLHAGAYKVDGNPYQALPDDARGRIQAQIDDVYDLFVASVAKHRPKLGDAGARATEAGVFMGTKAVAQKLADRVAADPSPSPQARRGSLNAGQTKAIAMSVHLNTAGESHASSLIEAGKIDRDSAWSFTAEDGDKLRGPDNEWWANYGRFHLDTGDKGHWKYPFGKAGKVYRHGVIAAKSRAAAEGAKDIEDAAARLLEKIDGRQEAGESAGDEQEKAAMADALALEAAKNDGRRDGLAEALARTNSILNSDAAKARPRAARRLALDGKLAGLSDEDVIELLADLPEEIRAAAGQRMAQTPNPNLRPDSSQRDPDTQVEIDAMWSGLVGEHNKKIAARR